MNNDYIDPRVIRTQILLEDSFIDLLEKKTYAQISIKDIVETANVNRSTFYLHYENKRDIFNKISYRCLDELFEEVRKIPLKQDTFDEIQKKTALKLFSTLYKNANFFKAMLLKENSTKYSTYMFKLISDFYTDKLNELESPDNYFEDSQSKDLFVNYISAAYLSVIRYWLKNNMPYTSEEIAHKMMMMNNHGPIGVIQMFKQSQKSKNTLTIF